MYVAALNPSQLVQGLSKRSDAGKYVWVVRAAARRKHAYPPHPLGLLRTRPEWPGCRTSN
jgi:hypothetical protein